jgi:hypothetical protein
LVIALGASSAKAGEICGSPRLTQALAYVSWEEKNLDYNQMARAEALEDASRIQGYAKTTAWTCSLLFLFCISTLAAAVTFRLLENRDLALFLGVIYFLFFSFVIRTSHEPIDAVTADFRAEATSPVRSENPPEIKGPQQLRRLVAEVHRAQAMIPEVFTEKSSYLPPAARWWTLGWDDVGLIEFQNEAFRALLRRGNEGLKTISAIREDLERQCRNSGIQI